MCLVQWRPNLILSSATVLLGKLNNKSAMSLVVFLASSTKVSKPSPMMKTL